MGSKMAAASRVVQVKLLLKSGKRSIFTLLKNVVQPPTVVKPHVPAIRFPDRKNSPKANVQEALKSMIYPFTAPPVTAHQATSENPPGAPRSTPVHKAHGSPDTSELLRLLPQKYRRKAVSAEEMDYIQRGGPE